jgi:hypothetical protein
MHPIISDEFRAAFEKPSVPNNTIKMNIGIVSKGWPIIEIKFAAFLIISKGSSIYK